MTRHLKCEDQVPVVHGVPAGGADGAHDRQPLVDGALAVLVRVRDVLHVVLLVVGHVAQRLRHHKLANAKKKKVTLR